MSAFDAEELLATGSAVVVSIADLRRLVEEKTAILRAELAAAEGKYGALINRLTLRLTGCSPGEYDSDAEMIQRIEQAITDLCADVTYKEQVTAELAAALGVAEKTISEAMKAASVMNLDRCGSFLSAYQLCGRDYQAILAARDKAQRRKGAVWALRGEIDLTSEDEIEGRNRLYRRIADIERGEVEVGGE